MQLANRLDIQLRSVVEWQELFHPDAVLLRQRYIYFLVILVFVKYMYHFVPVDDRGGSVFRPWTVHLCLVIGRISFEPFLRTSN